MVEFKDDSLVLSGPTGTYLKCKILGDYYELWWSITSGGKTRNYSNPTAIVEMNAGTGQDYVPQLQKHILGSSGHALEIKAGQFESVDIENPDTSNLKIILVEEDDECFRRLQNVIKKRWPRLSNNQKGSGVYTIHKEPKEAINDIIAIDKEQNLGKTLFFFDPLLYTPWETIEDVARYRITSYYKPGTEFIVFLFTTDWFKGRPSREVYPLPKTTDQQKWTLKGVETVRKADELFGHSEWREHILTDKPDEERMNEMIRLYRKRLHKWFRYVLTLPFEPSEGHRYHLFMCSNYEMGVRIVREFYSKLTGNPKYLPQNKVAHSNFLKNHPDKGITGRKRSNEWKILWKIITNHEEGLCDLLCQDLRDVSKEGEVIESCLKWLHKMGYLEPCETLTDAWPNPPQLYRLNWKVVQGNLGVSPPEELKPLSPSNFNAQLIS